MHWRELHRLLFDLRITILRHRDQQFHTFRSICSYHCSSILWCPQYQIFLLALRSLARSFVSHRCRPSVKNCDQMRFSFPNTENVRLISPLLVTSPQIINESCYRVHQGITWNDRRHLSILYTKINIHNQMFREIFYVCGIEVNNKKASQIFSHLATICSIMRRIFRMQRC